MFINPFNHGSVKTSEDDFFNLYNIGGILLVNRLNTISLLYLIIRISVVSLFD